MSFVVWESAYPTAVKGAEVGVNRTEAGDPNRGNERSRRRVFPGATGRAFILELAFGK